MTNEHSAEFFKCVYLLGEAFNEPVSELRLEAYWLALKDMELEAVQAATHAALKSCTFFPKPAELRKLVEGSADDRAELAWVDAQRLVRKVGSYGSPSFDDPAMKAAIDALGGWRAFCLSEDEPTYRANVFKRTYAAMTRRAEADKLLPEHAQEFIGLLTEGQ